MKKIVLFLFLSFGYALVANAQASQTETDTVVLKQYIGKYKFPEGSVVNEIVVNIENGGLNMIASVGTSPLKKNDGDVFEITLFQGIANFKRNDDKKVVGVSINAMGYNLEGTKEEAPAEKKTGSGK